jgi:large-conductance mechanosensitive channel
VQSRVFNIQRHIVEWSTHEQIVKMEKIIAYTRATDTILQFLVIAGSVFWYAPIDRLNKLPLRVL